MNVKKGWAELDKKRVGIVCGVFALACVVSTLIGWQWLALTSAIACVATPIVLALVAAYEAN